MPVRLGIELSPVACRIVELDSSRRFGRDGSATRVRSFARLPREGVQTYSRLSSFKQQPAAAVVWGLQADHRQAVVEPGSFRGMRREAVTAMRNAGVETRGSVADIAPMSRRVRGAATRPVVVALAPTHELAAALRWLTDQGVRVRSIVTPALALMSLARLRRESAAPGLTGPPGVLDAYVALEETTTAMALMRGGALAAACELEWGYQDGLGQTRPRGEIADRLANEIERFLAVSGERPNAVFQVCVCGGLPELRNMALALTEQLDVEVETLDSLFAIDAAGLPEPAHEFRDQSAELRLAWAVAADWPAPVDLLRERQRRLTKTILTRAAVVAGVATGVGVAWQIQRSDWWRSFPANSSSPPAPVSANSSSRPAAMAVAASARRPPVASPPAPRSPDRSSPLLSAQGPSVPPAPGPPVRSAPRPPVVPQNLPIAPAPSLPVGSASNPAVPPAVPQAGRPAASVIPPPPAIVREEARQPRFQAPPPTTKVPVPDRPAPSVTRAVPPPAPPPVVPPLVQPRAVPSAAARPPVENQRRQTAERRTAAPEPEPTLPFEAALGTILYAPERKLAIIDGRIVQVGDDVRGARVVDIAPTAVLLRDAQGRLRRLTLGAPGR